MVNVKRFRQALGYDLATVEVHKPRKVVDANKEVRLFYIDTPDFTCQIHKVGMISFEDSTKYGIMIDPGVTFSLEKFCAPSEHEFPVGTIFKYIHEDSIDDGLWVEVISQKQIGDWVFRTQNIICKRISPPSLRTNNRNMLP